MGCLQTQEEAITEISERLVNLGNSITPGMQSALKHIEQVWEKGVKEIQDGDGLPGSLTMKSCERMSELMLAAEKQAKTNSEFGNDVHQSLNALVGLRLIHQTMSLISKFQGINEGDKDCCPFCTDPC